MACRFKLSVSLGVSECCSVFRPQPLEAHLSFPSEGYPSDMSISAFESFSLGVKWVLGKLIIKGISGKSIHQDGFKTPWKCGLDTCLLQCQPFATKLISLCKLWAKNEILFSLQPVPIKACSEILMKRTHSDTILGVGPQVWFGSGFSGLPFAYEDPPLALPGWSVIECSPHWATRGFLTDPQTP